MLDAAAAAIKAGRVNVVSAVRHIIIQHFVYFSSSSSVEVAVPKLILDALTVRPLIFRYSISCSFHYGSDGNSDITSATAAVPQVVARTVDTNTGG